MTTLTLEDHIQQFGWSVAKPELLSRQDFSTLTQFQIEYAIRNYEPLIKAANEIGRLEDAEYISDSLVIFKQVKYNMQKHESSWTLTDVEYQKLLSLGAVK
jgi:hypothetical protein